MKNHIGDANKKVTAVEWLKKKIKETYDKEGKLPLGYVLNLVSQAKAMEKEQIEDAFDTGTTDEDRIGKEYYNETYGK